MQSDEEVSSQWCDVYVRERSECSAERRSVSICGRERKRRPAEVCTTAPTATHEPELLARDAQRSRE